MASFRLTERARNDLLDIFLFGIEAFGSRQAESYLADLEHTFGLLASVPKMGRLAKGVGLDVRRHEHGAHVIFYRTTDYGVRIAAIVHKSSIMDFEV
jgi:toxin ParE1/3/4